LRVGEKERPVRDRRLLVEDAIGSNDFALWKIAEERERQLEGFGEGLLREGQVRADRQILDPERFKALEVGLPGR
jgi:hypothetical protein